METKWKENGNNTWDFVEWLDIAEMMKESGETRLLIIFAFTFPNVFSIALNTNTNVKIIVMHYIMNNVSAL